jgi:hypothetical protein
VILGAVAALAGCGAGHRTTSTTDSASTTSPASATARVRYLDTARVARAIAQSIRAERAIDARVVCPDRIVQRRGFDFACLAIYPGGQTTFTVVQLDDRGHVSYAGD